MRFDRRLLPHFEWVLPLIVLAICGLGVTSVYSATYTPSRAGFPPLALRQLVWLGAGALGMLAMLTFDCRRLDRRAYLLYALVVAAVLAVPFVGDVAGGSRRWIRLGPVSLQPSEFAKLGLVIALAHYFARTPGAGLGLRYLAVPLVLIAVPAAAILVQPDLGSAALLVFVGMTMVVLGGVRLRWLLAIALPGIAMAPVLFQHLKEYQRQRILMFLDPTQDPLGAGYHIIQSKIAVGSGMMWGKGFLAGTQNHLDFLPEQHTDFIFSVFSEEWGFVGAAGLMMLYLAVLLRGMVIALRARDRFGGLLTLGLMSIVFWQVVVNVGMTTGMLPVVGIPLPFFSYGGSSLFCLLLGTGLVMNVSTRRFLF